MKTSSSLNFKKESAAFAKALQEEHLELGKLLQVCAENHEKAWLVKPFEFAAALAAHEAVESQRARTEAASRGCSVS